jgi:predicted glycoside hydrolase/deacetylase ChbG (UPF0249 family)
VATELTRIRITADDLGWSEAVNEGIALAAGEGVLSAVSVLVTGPAFGHGIDVLRAASRDAPRPSIGLHLDLTDFRAVAEPRSIASLVDDDGRFRRRSRRLMLALLLGAARREHVARELGAQLARLRAAGVSPGHLDGHRHAHLFPGLAGVVARFAGEHRLAFVRAMPLASPRGVTAGAMPERLALAMLWSTLAGHLPLPSTAHSVALAGLAEGRALEADWVVNAVHAARPGLTEIVTHPGLPESGTVGRAAGHDRSLDLAALRSPALRAALAAPGVELVHG